MEYQGVKDKAMSESNQIGNGKCITLIFPGQGTQSIGMGSKIFDKSHKSKMVLECASDIAGFDVRRLCSRGPIAELDKTKYQQVAITAVNIAAFEEVKDLINLGKYDVAGHSVGEFSALYAAGFLSLEDALRIVTKRGNLMQELAENTPGTMYAVKGINNEQVNSILEVNGFSNSIQVANDNTPLQQVVSGNKEAIKELSKVLIRMGVESIRLPVNGAWHSHQMIPGGAEFSECVASATFVQGQVSIWTNQSAQRQTDINNIKLDLSNNLYSTVRWRETINNIGSAYYLEVGSKKVLSRMLRDFPCVYEESNIDHSDNYI